MSQHARNNPDEPVRHDWCSLTPLNPRPYPSDDELTAELLRERSIEDANDQRDDTHDAECREEKARAMRRAKDIREGGVNEEAE